MKVLDPGHKYEIDNYDAGPDDQKQLLIFMKRIGPMYPGNVDPHFGTNCQELLRVLINRIQRLDEQDSCIHNRINLHLARQMLWNFEDRAAKRHGLDSFDFPVEAIEGYPACSTCGHIVCKGH